MKNEFFLYNKLMTLLKRITQAFMRGPLFIFFLGMIFFSVGGWPTYRQMVNQQNYIEVQGKVITHDPNCDDEGCTYYSVVRYQTNEGVPITYTTTSSQYPPEYEIGKTVTVFYSPDNPKDAFIKGEGFIIRTVFMSIGGVLILVYLISCSKNLINSFISEEE